MIEWQYYPKSDAYPAALRDVVDAFKAHETEIDSETHPGQYSNEALAKDS